MPTASWDHEPCDCSQLGSKKVVLQSTGITESGADHSNITRHIRFLLQHLLWLGALCSASPALVPATTRLSLIFCWGVVMSSSDYGAMDGGGGTECCNSRGRATVYCTSSPVGYAAGAAVKLSNWGGIGSLLTASSLAHLNTIDAKPKKDSYSAIIRF